MARKSSRLLSKGFKSKKITEEIDIEETQSISENHVETTTKDGTLRESRSKERNDESQTEKQTNVDPQQAEERQSEGPMLESEDDSEHTVSQEERVQTPAKRKRGKKSLISSSRLSKKVRECSYIDFKFFSNNGFYWNHWLNRIGCKNICHVLDVVDERVIKEFYENLSQLEDLSLKSRAGGKVIKITRKDLLHCFEMKEMKDDRKILTLSRNAIFQELNDGVGSFKEKDIFSTDFELLIRLLHKAVVDCILPKNGSTTTISIEEAMIVLAMKKNLEIDIPTMILKHIWRTRRNKPYGNVLMKFFKYKNVTLSPNFTPTVGLKKFGETNLKKMGILVSQKLWFSKDGAWYRHSKFSKFRFDWEKIKSLAEGELLLDSESGAESEAEDIAEDREKNLSSKNTGKEKMKSKKKKSYRVRTGGKFEIREGDTRIDESKSESDSEDVVPPPPGETSRSGLQSALLGLIDKKINDLKNSLTKSILQTIDLQQKDESQHLDPQQDSHPEVVMDDLPPENIDPAVPPTTSDPQLSSQIPPSEALNPQPEEEVQAPRDEGIKAATAEHIEPIPSEDLEALHKVAEDILTLNKTQKPDQPTQSQPQPSVPPPKTFPQRKKQPARKTVITRQSKKN